MFDEDVPETEAGLADLHAVCTPIDDDRLLVCAASNAALQQLSADTLAFMPDASDLPTFIRGDSHRENGNSDSADDSVLCRTSSAHPAARLNLLVGPHEPLVFRRARARRVTLSLGTLTLCAALAAIGLHHRAARDRDSAAGHTHRAHELAASLGRGVTPADLPALVGRARQAASAAANITEPADAAAPLAALLATWPTAHSINVQSIHAAGDTIALTLTIEGDSAAADFLRAFAAPMGWSLDEPRLTALGSTISRVARATGGESAEAFPSFPALTRINLTMRRSAPAPAAADGIVEARP